jgi:hypothetical protein
MSSWSIIRDKLVKDSRPNTIGRQIQLVAASDLMVALMKNLTDQEVAVAEWKVEPGLAEALSNRQTHDDLRNVGVIRGGV